MKDEQLSEEDRKRIHDRAFNYIGSFKAVDMIDARIEGFKGGAEYATRYERETLMPRIIYGRDTMNNQAEAIMDLQQQLATLKAERNAYEGIIHVLMHHVPDTPDFDSVRQKAKAVLNPKP